MTTLPRNHVNELWINWLPRVSTSIPGDCPSAAQPEKAYFPEIKHTHRTTLDHNFHQSLSLDCFYWKIIPDHCCCSWSQFLCWFSHHGLVEESSISVCITECGKENPGTIPFLLRLMAFGQIWRKPDCWLLFCCLHHVPSQWSRCSLSLREQWKQILYDPISTVSFPSLMVVIGGGAR